MGAKAPIRKKKLGQTGECWLAESAALGSRKYGIGCTDRAGCITKHVYAHLHTIAHLRVGQQDSLVYFARYGAFGAASVESLIDDTGKCE